MEKYNLTCEELFVINLLIMASIDEGHKEYLFQYFATREIVCNNQVKKTYVYKHSNKLLDTLVLLQEKGILTKENNFKQGYKFDPEAIIFNKNFLNNYRKCSGELGAELLEAYPTFCIINGSAAPLKNFAKQFKSLEDFCFAYGKKIGWKVEKHKEIIDLLNWAKDNKCSVLNTNIANFVISGMWDTLKTVKEKGIAEAVYYDNIKIV